MRAGAWFRVATMMAASRVPPSTALPCKSSWSMPGPATDRAAAMVLPSSNADEPLSKSVPFLVRMIYHVWGLAEPMEGRASHSRPFNIAPQ
jgi:hypothetical protein